MGRSTLKYFTIYTTIEQVCVTFLAESERDAVVQFAEMQVLYPLETRYTWRVDVQPMEKPTFGSNNWTVEVYENGTYNVKPGWSWQDDESYIEGD